MQFLRDATKSCTHRNLELLDIGVACSDGVAVISIAGELDVSNHHRLTKCLSDVSDAGATEVILDVEQLTFMDSAGLAALLASHGRMEAAGGSFSILGPMHIVQRILEMSGQVPYQRIHAVAV